MTHIFYLKNNISKKKIIKLKKEIIKLRAIIILFASIFFFHYQKVFTQSFNYKWETISAFTNAQAIAQGKDGTYWIGTTGGLLHYYPQNDSFKIYKIEDGLIALNVAKIGIDDKSGMIFTGSTDGKIGILNPVDNSWKYSTEIFSSSQYPERGINGFGFHNGLAYVLTGFGVGLYDITKNAFTDSYRFLGSIPRNTSVNGILFTNDNIYLATNSGIAYAPKISQNLASPTSWKVYSKQSNSLPSDTVLSIVEFDRKIYAGTNQGVCVLTTSDTFSVVKNSRVVGSNLFSIGANLYAGFKYGFPYFEIMKLNADSLDRICGALDDMNDFFILKNQTAKDDIYVCLKRRGFCKYNYTDDKLSSILPNTPTSNYFSGFVKTSIGDIWTVHGGRGFGDGFSVLRNGEWLRFRSDLQKDMTVDEIWNIGLGGENDVWLGSYGKGYLNVKYDNDKFQFSVYDRTNSPMRGVGLGGSYEVGTQVITDNTGRTWLMSFSPATNSGALLFSKGKGEDKFISAITPSGVNGDFRWITLDVNNTKWLGSDESGDARGLLYFNDNNTPTDPSDDITGRITTFDGLIDNIIKSLATDKDGILWVGTSKGLTALYNPSSTVKEKSQPRFQNFKPLADVTIRAVAIDALNRKWVGTDKGLYIINADGSEVIKQFTKENSPLASDKVLALLCDEATGIVFVGTDNGMNKITTEAVKSQEVSQLLFSPQPFVFSESQEVTISGLPSGATVKILTISGRLVREFQSPGGAVAKWDGRNNDGNFAQSGVYIVAGSSADGEQTALGKITFIKN